MQLNAWKYLIYNWKIFSSETKMQPGWNFILFFIFYVYGWYRRTSLKLLTIKITTPFSSNKKNSMKSYIPKSLKTKWKKKKKKTMYRRMVYFGKKFWVERAIFVMFIELCYQFSLLFRVDTWNSSLVSPTMRYSSFRMQHSYTWPNN